MSGQVSLAEPSLQVVSDGSLMRRLQTGSQDAATQLYLRYAKRLHALSRAKCSPDLAARVDSDDIVQSVFRTFFRRVEKGEYDVPDGEELWKLFLVIGLNKIQTVGGLPVPLSQVADLELLDDITLIAREVHCNIICRNQAASLPTQRLAL